MIRFPCVATGLIFFSGLIVALIMNSRASGMGNVVRELFVVGTSIIDFFHSAARKVH